MGLRPIPNNRPVNTIAHHPLSSTSAPMYRPGDILWKLTHGSYRHARRVVVIIGGFSVLLLGILGMIVPIMPGFIFIPVALGILAIEFEWARRALKRVKQMAADVQHKVAN